MARPNIVLIVAHQMRWDSIQVLGHTDLVTPNLDALARHGVFFDNAFSQHTNSAPARASLLTGRYPARHGVRSPLDLLPEDLPSLPALLRQAGYTTGAAGGFGFRWPEAAIPFDFTALAEFGPLAGHDEYHAWLDREGLSDPLPDFKATAIEDMPAQVRAGFGCMPFPHGAGYSATQWIGNQAIRFVQGAPNPFFLYIGFPGGHPPYLPTRAWLDRVNPAALTVPKGVEWPFEPATAETVFPLETLTYERYQQILAHYYAAIGQMDHQIGRILATLSARGHTNNVVVFAADHGALLGEDGLLHPRIAPPRDPRIRVPLLVSGARDQRQNAREPAMVELMDVLPTLLDIGEASALLKTTGGQSLVPLLRGAAAEHRRAIYSESQSGARIVRNAHFKLIDSPNQGESGLFDLDADPHEKVDLRGRPDLAKEQVALTKALRRLR